MEIRPIISQSWDVVKYAAPVPIFVSAVLAFWFYIIQDPVTGALFPGSGASSILDGIIQSLSHIDRQHLISNITGVLGFGFYLAVLRGRRILAIDLLVLFIASSIFVMTLYTRAVGFSIVVYGLIGIMIVPTIQTCIVVYRNSDGFNKSSLQVIVPLTLIVLVSIPSVAFDISVSLNIVSIDQPSIFSYIVSDLPNEYTRTSSIAHSSGFIFGLISGFINRYNCSFLEKIRP